ncbi:Transposon Ty1-PL Gag-Pol polyprotein [Durusdinium trenchii]
MLVYLSTRREARDVVEQYPIQSYTESGGLQLLWKVLDEAFGESDAELFERVDKELERCRRQPGETMAHYLSEMKRLKAQYSRVDPESKISDMAWGQRLLQRASLSRRERHDVFYAAGAGFQSSAIEKALRIRCGRIHEDEKKGHFRSYDDESTAYKPKNQHFYKKKIITKKEGEGADEELMDILYEDELEAQEDEDTGLEEEEPDEYDEEELKEIFVLEEGVPEESSEDKESSVSEPDDNSSSSHEVGIEEVSDSEEEDIAREEAEDRYKNMCGGSSSVTNFTTADAMTEAGWVFSSDESTLFSPDSEQYSGAYRGYSDSGVGTVSLQLQGHGVVAVTFGSDSSGNVTVKMNDIVHSTALPNTASQTVEIGFSTGDVLQFEEDSSIILIQELDFVCDPTSANVPVWAYHETVPSSELPYTMGVQSDLQLNAASYTIMMWLKQGPSEPDESIIIGQFIDTSTTTTSTSTSTTSTTITSTTSSTTQSTTTQLCTWNAYEGLFSNGYADGIRETFDLWGAKEKCKTLGASVCKAVTCSDDICTVRASRDLYASPTGETSYLPSSLCYYGGYRISVGDPRSGVGGVAKTLAFCFIMYSGFDIRSRFSSTFMDDMADHFVCVRYASGWVYDDSSGGEVSFVPRDSDVLVAEVDVDSDTVTSLEGTDTYYHYVTQGYNSGDLTFYVDKNDSAIANATRSFYISGTYFITQSIDTVAYPSVLATSLTEPSEFSSSEQTMEYYQYHNSDQPEIHMQVDTYYTGANSTMWKIFDGDFTSSTQIQEPDLLWESELLEARVHSVTLYTTSSDNDYVAYWRTSDYDGTWSTGDIQTVSSNWVQQDSYWKWEIPIKASTTKLEIHLREADLDFNGTPSSNESRCFHFSGFEVNLRHSVTTTSSSITMTTTSKTATSSTASTATTTSSTVTVTVTAYPSVAFNEITGNTCEDDKTSSGLSSAQLDECKLACFIESTYLVVKLRRLEQENQLVNE